MICHMEILKICLEEQLLIKLVIVLAIQIMMVINIDLLQWFITFFEKKSGVAVKTNN